MYDPDSDPVIGSGDGDTDGDGDVAITSTLPPTSKSEILEITNIENMAPSHQEDTTDQHSLPQGLVNSKNTNLHSNVLLGLKPQSPPAPTATVHREISPVSPRPIHVAEPSNIPLLMDPELTQIEAPSIASIAGSPVVLDQDVPNIAAPTQLPLNKLPTQEDSNASKVVATAPSLSDAISATGFAAAPLQPNNEKQLGSAHLIQGQEMQIDHPALSTIDHSPSQGSSAENISAPQHTTKDSPTHGSVTMASSSLGATDRTYADNTSLKAELGLNVDDPKLQGNNVLSDAALISSNKGVPVASGAFSTTTSSIDLSNSVDIQALLANLAPPNPNIDPSLAADEGVSAVASGELSANAALPIISPEHYESSNPLPLSIPSMPLQQPISGVLSNASITSNASQIAKGPVSTSLPQPPSDLRHPLPNMPPAASTVELDDEERPFTDDEERDFEAFTTVERDYVSKGQWDRFPTGSRLFIGNLPTEKVTKRDLFRKFSKHGKLAQVSIKQAYGFIQFFDAHACAGALRSEQGASIRGRKMHLEISKPQKNTKGNDAGRGNRRSRSPDPKAQSPRRRESASSYRGTAFPERDYHNRDRGITRDRERERERDRDRDRDKERDRGRDRDRDRGGDRSGDRDRDRDRNREKDNTRDRGRRGRDEYRGTGRRFSPGRRGSRDEEHGRRYRDRSRSPMTRYRTPSPISSQPQNPLNFQDDDLPLPKRAPHDVPEVQIIVFEELDRNFIRYIENAFRDRSIKVDVLFLAPRLSLQAVIKRQIIEGVLAVVFLNRQAQAESKLSMQVFDRRLGNANARYDEYDNIDPSVAAELVNRARQVAPHPPPGMAYGVLPYSAPVMPQVPNPLVSAALPAALAGNANLTALISSLDPVALQKLLSSLQGQPNNLANSGDRPPAVGSFPIPNLNTAQPDISALLAQGSGASRLPQFPTQAPHQQPQQQQQYCLPGNLGMPLAQNNAALAGLLSSANPANPQASQLRGQQPPNQQVQNIMEQLTQQWAKGR